MMPRMLIDLHVHTHASECSSLSIRDIIAHGRRLGLEGVCITDHHSMAVLDHITPGRQPNGLLILVGQEYHTDRGDFLLFGPRTPLPRDIPAEEVLTTVAVAGGVAVAAHPCRKAKPTAENVFRKGLCRIVESVNGRNQSAENRDTAQWQKKYALTGCAGSDAHCLEELGKVRTRFSVPILGMEDLVFALKQGFCTPHFPVLPN